MYSARAAEIQTVQSFQRTLTKDVGYKYLLALPTGYDAHAEKVWPLIFFLHGSGERGNDVWSISRHGPPQLLRHEVPPPPDETAEAKARREAAAKALAENFIVVSPQCQKGDWWDTEALLALLDDITGKLKIDPRRIYLTGLSMGGYAAWELGLAHPERFAAIIPICGGGSSAILFQAKAHKRQYLRTLGIWAFHGAKDDAVLLNESQRMVDMLTAANIPDVTLTVYPNAGHNSWTATYSNPEIYSWLLKHERVPVKREQESPRR
jgi:predicted peptidase